MKKTFLGGSAIFLTVAAVCSGGDAVTKSTVKTKTGAKAAVEAEKSKSQAGTPKTASESSKTVSKKDKKTTGKDNGRSGHRHAGSLSIRQNRFQKFLFNQLPKAEKEKLKKLYKKNPSAYYKELTKIAQRFRKQDAELDKRVLQLAKQYKNEKDPDKKEKLLKRITWITRRQFYFRLEETRRSLDESERKLRELKALYHSRKNNAKAIIERRIKDLTDSNLDW